MKKIEIPARNRQQALARAAEKLGVPVDQLLVIEEYDPDQRDLEALAAIEEGLSDEEKEGEPGLYVIEADSGPVRAEVEEWIAGLIARFQPGGTCSIEVDGDNWRALIDCDEPSILIGKQGQTLAALQHVVNRVVPLLAPDAPQVLLDTGDYRARKEEKLEAIASRAARMAVQRRRSQRLLPMNAVDRKFVHNFLKDFPGIRTQSTGSDPNRCVMILAEGEGEGGGRRRGGGAGSGRARPSAPPPPKARKKPLEQPPPPAFGDGPEEPADYEEVEINERTSLLPKYDEDRVDAELLRDDRPLVDELE